MKRGAIFIDDDDYSEKAKLLFYIEDAIQADQIFSLLMGMVQKRLEEKSNAIYSSSTATKDNKGLLNKKLQKEKN